MCSQTGGFGNSIKSHWSLILLAGGWGVLYLFKESHMLLAKLDAVMLPFRKSVRFCAIPKNPITDTCNVTPWLHSPPSTNLCVFCTICEVFFQYCLLFCSFFFPPLKAVLLSLLEKKYPLASSCYHHVSPWGGSALNFSSAVIPRLSGVFRALNNGSCIQLHITSSIYFKEKLVPRISLQLKIWHQLFWSFAEHPF